MNGKCSMIYVGFLFQFLPLKRDLRNFSTYAYGFCLKLGVLESGVEHGNKYRVVYSLKQKKKYIYRGS